MALWKGLNTLKDAIQDIAIEEPESVLPPTCTNYTEIYAKLITKLYPTLVASFLPCVLNQSEIEAFLSSVTLPSIDDPPEDVVDFTLACIHPIEQVVLVGLPKLEAIHEFLQSLWKNCLPILEKSNIASHLNTNTTIHFQTELYDSVLQIFRELDALPKVETMPPLPAHHHDAHKDALIGEMAMMKRREVDMQRKLKEAEQLAGQSRQVSDLKSELDVLRDQLRLRSEEALVSAESLEKLQAAVEDIQRENTIQLESIESQYQQRLDEKDTEILSLRKQLMTQSSTGELQREYNELKTNFSQVSDERRAFKSESERLRQAMDGLLHNNQEADTVDRRLVSSLIVRYIENEEHRDEVLQIIAGILNLTKQERIAIGLQQSHMKPALSDMWISFLTQNIDED